MIAPIHTEHCTRADNGKCISYHCNYCGKITNSMGHQECINKARHDAVADTAQSDEDLEVEHGDCPDCGDILTFDPDQCTECGWNSEDDEI